MTIKASAMGNLPIITINDGKKVSKVKDVIYDGQTNHVKALLIDEKGWFKGARILMLSDINSIGHDAVIIKDEDCFVYSDEVNDSNIAVIVDDNNFMTKNKVMTESGTDLGRVTDLFFDFPTGEVVTIEVSKGFMHNLGSGAKNINIHDIITIGEDNLIVRDFTEEAMEIQGQEQGVNKLATDTKDKATSIIDAAKSKIDEVVHSKPVQDTMDKTKEIAGNVKEKVVTTYQGAKENIESGQAQEHVQNAMDKTKEIAGNVKEKVVTTYHDAKDNVQSGQAQEDMQGKMNEGKEKIEAIEADVHQKVSQTYDSLKEEAQTAQTQAAIEAKIHESKKELKSAIKESRDNQKIDV